VFVLTAVSIHASPDGSRSSQYCSKLVPPFRKTVPIAGSRIFLPCRYAEGTPRHSS
jgi:hypothetical protein